MTHTVETDDEIWELEYELGDGVYPVGWRHMGFLISYEPPPQVYDELTRKAYSHFHEQRCGACE